MPKILIVLTAIYYYLAPCISLFKQGLPLVINIYQRGART